MKPILILLLVFIISSNVFSQKKTIDLSIVPMTPDSTVLGDSTRIMIQFKINYPDSILNFQMKFGTVQDIADIALLSPTILFSNTKYYTLLNGDQNEITDYDARIYYKLSENQMNLYNYLTLVVSYIDGTSETLYWLKQDQNP
ncbi:MAG: hypothetical protein HY951_07165 [Bacteroidia bacterium]|nr:hypothetical protein [Bacteroidia bacterium]